MASTTSAGIIVTARRTTSGIRTSMKPAITTWPAYVPTLDEDTPDASSATANASAAVPPTRRPSSACACSIVLSPESACVWKSFAAAASIARLMTPATPSATITAGREQRHVEEEVEAERGAEELRDVGRHRHHLRLHPEPAARPARVVVTAELRKAPVGDDPELRR